MSRIPVIPPIKKSYGQCRGGGRVPPCESISRQPSGRLPLRCRRGYLIVPAVAGPADSASRRGSFRCVRSITAVSHPHKNSEIGPLDHYGYSGRPCNRVRPARKTITAGWSKATDYSWKSSCGIYAMVLALAGYSRTFREMELNLSAFPRMGGACFLIVFTRSHVGRSTLNVR